MNWPRSRQNKRGRNNYKCSNEPKPMQQPKNAGKNNRPKMQPIHKIGLM